MTKGASSILLVTRVWYAWCWRNNTIFEDQHCRIQDVVRKTFLLHDECISYYHNPCLYPHSSRLLTHWIPPPEGTLKLNIDGSFFRRFWLFRRWWCCSQPRWRLDSWFFSRAIQIGLDFCSKKGYVNIICESDCLKAVDLIIAGRDHTLHTYAIDILHIKDALHGMEIQHWCMLLENKICVQILCLRKNHI